MADDTTIGVGSQSADSAGQSAEALRRRGAYLYALFEFSPFTTVVVDKSGKIIDFNQAKKRSGDRLPRVGEIMYRDYAAHHSVDMHGEMMQVIESGTPRSFPELPYNDKVLAVTIAPFPDGAIIVSQDVTEAKRAERDMLALIDQLHRALREIETLRELLPICANCKRIRDDGGYWNGVEEYFGKRSRINFSHTLCPDCARKLYPEVYGKLDTPGESAEPEQ
ncbi:MAG: hypothetical protein GF331_24085 [Chitinivibrionales bacterium]|nr:hypothetical protein [Chitinivibrionales bacterium]